MTFSSRLQESSLQFVDPVQTSEPSLTTYLWCMRSGTPRIRFVGTARSSSRLGSAWGGGGSGIGLSWSTLKASRTSTPRPLRLEQRRRDQLRRLLLEVEVVEGEIEGLLGGGQEAGRVLGDLERGLASVPKSAELDVRRSRGPGSRR